ncbi:hypothetical protein BT96DRAFT_942161 [Gymnopus androsaceus JB14]|uniref:DUF6818 domain-containing protein n=1 Tax=Gymnopus androsaceus JB14 TaxID=1447944 RepID=A0A6A4HC08_9AGAR|nr:hypothetical protein BT96DRAFT_942161 [Gymnopus androsaceus JB14]
MSPEQQALPQFIDAFPDSQPRMFSDTPQWSQQPMHSTYAQNMPHLNGLQGIPPHQDQYFRPSQGQASGSGERFLPTPIDPVRVPVPDDDNDDFPSISKILATVAYPSNKTAGSRGTNKGKGVDKKNKKHKASASHRKEPSEKRQKGRSTGAANYNSVDIQELLDLARELLPLGRNSLADEYNHRIEEIGHPQCTARSLELKFKAFVKMTKPTGDAECPPHIEEAHEIKDLMNAKADSCDLDNEDILDEVIEVDSNDGGNESDIENVPPLPKKKLPAKKVQEGPVARCMPSDRLAPSPYTRQNANQEILANISNALDPAAQHARSEEHSARALQTTQILTLNGQIRDLQCSMDMMRGQLADANREIREAERRANRAERRADRAEDDSQTLERLSFIPYPSRRQSQAPERSRTYQEVHYPEDGHATRSFFTDEMNTWEYEDMERQDAEQGAQEAMIFLPAEAGPSGKHSPAHLTTE